MVSNYVQRKKRRMNEKNWNANCSILLSWIIWGVGKTACLPSAVAVGGGRQLLEVCSEMWTLFRGFPFPIPLQQSYNKKEKPKANMFKVHRQPFHLSLDHSCNKNGNFIVTVITFILSKWNFISFNNTKKIFAFTVALVAFLPFFCFVLFYSRWFAHGGNEQSCCQIEKIVREIEADRWTRICGGHEIVVSFYF